MQYAAEGYAEPCFHYANALAAPVIVADLGLGNGHEVPADEGVPCPIGLEFAGLDNPAFGGCRALGNLGPGDEADLDSGAALEQREERSEHGESLARNGVRKNKISDWIASALDGSGWTPEEVFEGVRAGVFHLFTHEEGCMVGEFIVSPRHRVMHVWAAGGSLKAMTELVPEVEAFGRRNGCDIGGATGRKGWARFSRRFGYGPAVPAVSKEL